MRRKFPWNGLAGRICACFLVACLASVPLCAISATTTAESGGMAKQNVAANGEFSAVSNAVVELLRSRDAAAFPSALAPSIADYQSLLPTNLPPQVQEAFKTMRANVESSAKTFLEQAVVDGGANMYEKRRFEIAALWQNLWVKMAHSASRQASPLRVATGGDASWRLEARRRRSPACWRNAWPPPAATSGRMLAGLITL